MIFGKCFVTFPWRYVKLAQKSCARASKEIVRDVLCVSVHTVNARVLLFYALERGTRTLIFNAFERRFKQIFCFHLSFLWRLTNYIFLRRHWILVCAFHAQARNVLERARSQCVLWRTRNREYFDMYTFIIISKWSIPRCLYYKKLNHFSKIILFSNKIFLLLKPTIQISDLNR